MDTTRGSPAGHAVRRALMVIAVAAVAHAAQAQGDSSRVRRSDSTTARGLRAVQVIRPRGRSHRRRDDRVRWAGLDSPISTHVLLLA